MAAIRIEIHPLFSTVVMFTILCNLLTMIMTPTDEFSSRNKYWQSVIENIFTAVYTFEMMVKVLGRGFVGHTFSYLRSGWNILDFIIIIVAYITIVVEQIEFYDSLQQNHDPSHSQTTLSSNLTFLRSIRVLRVLKTVSVIPALRTIVAALTTAVKKLKDSIILTLCGISIFALIGQELFQDSLRQKCFYKESLPDTPSSEISPFWVANNASNMDETNLWKHQWASNISNRHAIVTNQVHSIPQLCSMDLTDTGYHCKDGQVCLPWGDNPNFNYTNFDDFMHSFIAGFRISLQDSWEELYTQIILVKGKEYALYFIMIIFFIGTYLVNLILAVVASAYEQQRKYIEALLEEEKRDLLNQKIIIRDRRKGVSDMHQQQIIELQQSLLVNPYWAKILDFTSTYLAWENDFCYNTVIIRKLRDKLDKITEHQKFEMFIIVLVLFNCAIMSCEHFFEESKRDIFTELNLVFTVVFTLEAVLKIIGKSPAKYFIDNWNVFDFIVVVCSLVEIFVASQTEDTQSNSMNVIRTFRLIRIVRILKIAKSWPTLNQLITLIGDSLANIGYLILILMILMIIFALTGSKLVGKKYFLDPETGLELRWHMHDFPHALMVVFRMQCGEWIENMWNCMRCTETTSGHIMCIVVFIANVVFGNLVVLNLFLALLLNSFSSDQLKAKDKNKDDKAFRLKVHQVLLKGTIWLRRKVKGKSKKDRQVKR